VTKEWFPPEWNEDYYKGEVVKFNVDERDGRRHAIGYEQTEGTGFVPVKLLTKQDRVPHGWGTMCCVERDGVLGDGVSFQGGGQKIEGFWKNGVLDGHGTYWFPNGDRYAGIFRDGEPGSKGTYWYASGDVFRGDCLVEREVVHDTMTSPDRMKQKAQANKKKSVFSSSGKKVFGEAIPIQGFKRHGGGSYWYPNGSRYEGQFIENMRSGWGTMFYADGERQNGIYEGEWLQGEANGKGAFYFASGKIEMGKYAKGDATSWVRWTADRKEAWHYDGKEIKQVSLKDAAAKAEGMGHEMENGLPTESRTRLVNFERDKFLENQTVHGDLPAFDKSALTTSRMENQYDTLEMPDGSRYVGFVLNGKPEDQSGRAQMIYSNNSRYEGEFSNGKHHGSGFLLHSDSSRYKGEFRTGFKEGFGTMWHNGGDSYVGDFRAGHRQGLGWYFYTNDAVSLQGYEAGNPVGPGVWWNADRSKCGRLLDGKLVQQINPDVAATLASRMGYPGGPPGGVDAAERRIRKAAHRPEPVDTTRLGELEATMLPRFDQDLVIESPGPASPLLPPRPPLTPPQMSTSLDALFNHINTSNTGKISVQELSTALRTGLIHDLFSQIAGGKGNISREDLVRALRSGLLKKVPQKTNLFCRCGNEFVDDTVYCRRCGYERAKALQLAKIQKLFEASDVDHSGTIELQEFKTAFRALGLNMTDTEALSLFRSLDLSGDNKLHFNEYANLWRDSVYKSSRVAQLLDPTKKPESSKEQKELARLSMIFDAMDKTAMVKSVALSSRRALEPLA
jgi:hypothetical protein